MIPACFVCGSEYICSHREHELRVYWQRMGGEYPTAGTVASVREYRSKARPFPLPAASGFRVSVRAEDAFRRRA
jgi:hypothetical protein